MWKTVVIAVLALIPVGYADAQIPQVEREALIALYTSTTGYGWKNDTGWLGTEGTECTWKGVVCSGGHVTYLTLVWNDLNGSLPPEIGNLTHLLQLNLYDNEFLTGSIPSEIGNLTSMTMLKIYNCALTGSLPPELGTLSSLQQMWLSNNQLTGSIPPEMGDLSNLDYLLLTSNQLSGDIPPELGQLSTMTYLNLTHNRLSGSIPPELGNLSSLSWLYLDSNRLSGSIPTELQNLGLVGGCSNGLEIRWNALHSDDAALITWLNNRQYGCDWQSTQTVAPVNLVTDQLGDHTVWLSWDAVAYTRAGGYEVFSSPAGSGVWISGGWTESKTETTFPLTGLDSGTSYDFVVVTYTDPHFRNQSVVNSDFSTSVMATTDSGGCVKPFIKVAGVGPFTLSVTESYDSYTWSTGETTASIVVNPPPDEWFWVTVTSAGPCEETAAILVDPNIFADGFESGDTTAWSNAVP